MWMQLLEHHFFQSVYSADWWPEGLIDKQHTQD